jgi:hypothetical protein
MAKKPKQAPTIFDQAWRRLASLLQLDLFGDRDAVARNARAELQALEHGLKESHKPRST